MVVSDKVCHYIVGYQTNGALMPLLIKTPKYTFSHGASQYDKNSAYTVSFNFSEEKNGGFLSIKRFGIKWSHNYLKNWQQNR